MNTAPGFCFVVHIIDNIRIVCYRLCIRHGQHCRISTMRSGLHPGINILFLFKSRIAEMYMHINKSRHHNRVTHILCPVHRFFVMFSNIENCIVFIHYLAVGDDFMSYAVKSNDVGSFIL